MLTIREILRGCEVGRIQTVGAMQVIPLILEKDMQDTRFATPDIVQVGTSSYGTMNFTNPASKPLLLPSHVGYVVKQAAQDHAMATAGIVPAKRTQSWDNAMCIQSTQGGLISRGDHKMIILPLALRKPALEKRKTRSYNKLWNSIGSYNTHSGLGSSQALVTYMQGYERQLDQFIAEFELVENQVGAIILINGEMVGCERAPSTEYWNSVWEPLVRVCYGSAAIAASKQAQQSETVLKTRVPLKVRDLSNIDDLCAELESVEARQEELARKQVREMLDDQFERDQEQSAGHASADIVTIRNDQFFGQVATDQTSGKVLYASMVVADGWDARKGWKLASRFDI